MACAPDAYVYALTDPAGWVRYVGQSRNPWARLGNHRNAGATQVCAWLAELAESGEEPGIIILQTVDEGAGIDQIERLWIERFSKTGSRLLNKSSSAITGPRPAVSRIYPKRRCSRGSEELRERIGAWGGQTRLAQKVGTTASVICRWVSGERKPDARARIALEGLLRIPISWWDEPANADTVQPTGAQKATG